MDPTKRPNPAPTPPPDIKTQFQRVLDLMYQKGNNLSESERHRMETCYVLGAQLSMVVIQTALNCPIDSVQHMLMMRHQSDVADSMERVHKTKP